MNNEQGVIGPVNIGNPGEFTIKELAELVVELTGTKAGLEKRPLPPDDPTRRQPDIGLAKKHLNWEPKIPLREGLQKTINWFKTIDLDQYRPPTPNYV
jgi:UDP-glucuronate decarboxylase